MNRESEIHKKKHISESNTVNNIWNWWFSIRKNRVICTCSSSPRAASKPGGTDTLPSPTRINSSLCLSVRPYVCTYLQIRYSAQNGTGPIGSVNNSPKSWIHDVNCESEILRKKCICKSNTVNNMKLMILEKIRAIHTCSSSSRAASVGRPPLQRPGFEVRGDSLHQSLDDSPLSDDFIKNVVT